MKLLHLDSSIQGENSASRLISAAVVKQLRQAQSPISTLPASTPLIPPPRCSSSLTPTSS